MERRRFVLAATSAGIAGIAGCIGGDDDGGTDGSDDGGDSNGGDGGTDGSDDGGDSNGGDGGNGGGDDGGDSNGDDGGNVGGDAPRVGDLIRWEDSFVAEISGGSGMEGTAQTVRFSGSDVHYTANAEPPIEVYKIDEETYVVTGERCLVGTDQAPPNPARDGAVFTDEESLTNEQADLTPAGTGTIDGEEVYVYELPGGPDPSAIHVSAERGYLRRAEFGEVTVDYHTWGDVGPIEPPDMNCQSVPGGGGGGE